jgi:hypothetical protein
MNKMILHLCLVETSLISFIQFDTLIQFVHQEHTILIPKLRTTILVNVFLAGRNHLICYFDKKTRHSLGGVVVSGNGVDHSDCVDKTRNRGNHSHGVGGVERLVEALEGV